MLFEFLLGDQLKFSFKVTFNPEIRFTKKKVLQKMQKSLFNSRSILSLQSNQDFVMTVKCNRTFAETNRERERERERERKSFLYVLTIAKPVRVCIK